MSLSINCRQMGRMVLSVAIGMVALALTAFADATPHPSEAAQPIRFDVPAGGRWCAVQDTSGARLCRYETFEHCVAAVGTYGICRPNPAAVSTIDAGPYRTYHSLSRIGTVTVMAD
jgi:hypothetical protein